MLSMNNLEIEAIELSIKVALNSVLFTLPLGLIAAWILARKRFYGYALFNGIVHLPLVLPPVVVGFFLLTLLGRNGFIGNILENVFDITLVFSWQGAAIASAVMSFPLMVRAIKISIESIDLKLEDAARTLGASPIKIFYSITLPLIFPGIISGILLSFARSLGEFGATITFVSNIPGETNTLPLSIYSFIQTPGGEADALRLVIFSIIIAMIALISSEYLTSKAKKNLEG